MQADRRVGPSNHPTTSQPRANVSQRRETTFAGAVGPDAQPFSVITSGSMVRECAAPSGVWVVLSHCPSHGAGALKEVAIPPGMLHASELAVSVDGRAHDPVGGSHVHASQRPGATRSVCPS